MQSNDSGGLPRLIFFCKDPDSVPGEDCPSFYRTDRESWVVQGEQRAEPEVVGQLLALKADEVALEIPERLAELFVRMYARERYGVDLG
ncbi:hypothetical protein LO762_24020 [Actinocorallia sp. API 0066]|uniref:hypothetical protein n=1 Tax=Actinocorallia sp. API 0066 TaxID=2896846 RepID=UPI001E4EB1C7|nr:hypothetical protein [Actinocorallia sp. API 0066]MCD0452235.1 hypothetical protein [Actinocorallia sp. API 0066]